MKKLVLFLALLVPSLCLAQGVRFSSTVQQQATVGTATNVVTLPAAPQIAFCNHPANAVPCTNKATTYQDQTLAVSCSTSTQIVLDGTTTCVSSPDSQNNWGVWVAPNSSGYDYTITLPGGVNKGPFNVLSQNTTLNVPITINSPGSLTVSGTQTNTGALNLTGPSAALLGCRVEGIRYVDVANLCGWSGTDIKGWIASAFADLPSSNGTVFVTNGTYTETTGSITVGVSPCVNPPSTGNGQTLITDTGVVLTINHSIVVLCGGTLDKQSENQFGGWVIAGGSFPSNAPMIDIGDTTNGAINATVAHQRLNGNSVTGVTIIRARQINDNTVIRGNLGQNYMTAGLLVDGTSGVTGNFMVTENLFSASSSATAGDCMKFITVQVAHVWRNSCVSSAAGNQAGGGAYFTGTSTVGSSVINLHCEKMTDCVKVDSAHSLNLNLIDAGNGTTNTFHIYAGGTGTYEAHSLANNGNGAGFPVVKNDISGTSISSANPPLPNGQLPFYSNVKGDEFWMDGTQIQYSPTSSAHTLLSFGQVWGHSFYSNAAPVGTSNRVAIGYRAGDTTGVWNANGGSTFALPQTVVLHTAYTNATTTFSTFSDGTRSASFSVAASTDYTLSCKILYQGSVTTAGPKVQLTGPSTPTAVMLSVDGGTNATAYADAGAAAFSTAVTAFGTLGAATTNFTLHIEAGISNGANAGTVALQLAANGAGTLTVQPGSFCVFQ